MLLPGDDPLTSGGGDVVSAAVLTLSEFVLARIAEDEASARAATAVPDGVERVQTTGASREVPVEADSDSITPMGSWGWHGGPVNHDSDEMRMLAGIFGDEPRSGVEMQPYQVMDSGGWDEAEPVGAAYYVAEVPARCEGVAQHIARHDPARVLAEAETKRRIVALHGDNGFGESCMTCVDPSAPDAQSDHPCRTLRVIAAVYFEHPDYRSEWRP